MRRYNRIPFISTPKSAYFQNNRSAIQNSDFVQGANNDLLSSGRITELENPSYIVNSSSHNG